MTEEKKTGRGGKREGAGRKKGSLSSTPRTERTYQFTKRITKDEKKYLEKCLEEYRQKNNG